MLDLILLPWIVQSFVPLSQVYRSVVTLKDHSKRENEDKKWRKVFAVSFFNEISLRKMSNSKYNLFWANYENNRYYDFYSELTSFVSVYNFMCLSVQTSQIRGPERRPYVYSKRSGSKFDSSLFSPSPVLFLAKSIGSCLQMSN